MGKPQNINIVQAKKEHRNNTRNWRHRPGVSHLSVYIYNELTLMKKNSNKYNNTWRSERYCERGDRKAPAESCGVAAGGGHEGRHSACVSQDCRFCSHFCSVPCLVLFFRLLSLFDLWWIQNRMNQNPNPNDSED